MAEGDKSTVGAANVKLTGDATSVVAATKQGEAAVKSFADKSTQAAGQIGKANDENVKGFRQSIAAVKGLIGSILAIGGIAAMFYRVGTAIRELITEQEKSASLMRKIGDIDTQDAQSQLKSLKGEAEDLAKAMGAVDEPITGVSSFLSRIYSRIAVGSQAGTAERKEMLDRRMEFLDLSRRIQFERKEQAELQRRTNDLLEKMIQQQRDFSDKMLSQIVTSELRLGEILILRSESLTR